jgi:transposase InsO family protein
VVGQHRSTQRKPPCGRPDEDALTGDIIRLASRYGRYGYRRITALLRTDGWHVNAKRVERIWRREGLKVPRKHPKRGRLWLNDGSCVRLRAERPGHVWSYDFVMDRTHDGRAFRMLTVIDEFTRQSLAIHVDRKLTSESVLDCISDLFIKHGPPKHIRSDNGAEFTAQAVRDWLNRLGVKTLFIEPGSPWENGYNENRTPERARRVLGAEANTLAGLWLKVTVGWHTVAGDQPCYSCGLDTLEPVNVLAAIMGAASRLSAKEIDALRYDHDKKPRL